MDKLKAVAGSMFIGFVLGLVTLWAVTSTAREQFNQQYLNAQNRIADLERKLTASEATVTRVQGLLDISLADLTTASGTIKDLRAEVSRYREEISGYRITLRNIQDLIGRSSEGIDLITDTIERSLERIERLIRLVEEIERSLPK